MDECQTWTMEERLASNADERFKAGCSTHEVVFTGAKQGQVTAALEAHVAEND